MSVCELVRQAVRNPYKATGVITKPARRHFVGQELNKAFHSRFGYYEYNSSGINIFAEDWDNLIILDALRYDSMNEAVSRNQLSWDVESRISRGSQTPEWLYANFSQKKLHDVVYVTASAMPHYLGIESGDSNRQREYGFNLDIHDLINVWADPPENSIDTYVDRDETSVVVPAESMIRPAMDAVERYPNKRILVHIVQPHAPYIGPTGKKLHKKSDSPLVSKLRRDLDVPIETIRKAYRENVDQAVIAAKSIAEELPGKTVISADHGEYLLDRSSPIPIREILHPDKTYTDVLTKVPWVEFSDRRRTISSDAPTTKNNIESTNTNTNEQLAALGYK